MTIWTCPVFQIFQTTCFAKFLPVLEAEMKENNYQRYSLYDVTDHFVSSANIARRPKSRPHPPRTGGSRPSIGPRPPAFCRRPAKAALINPCSSFIFARPCPVISYSHKKAPKETQIIMIMSERNGIEEKKKEMIDLGAWIIEYISKMISPGINVVNQMKIRMWWTKKIGQLNGSEVI